MIDTRDEFAKEAMKVLLQASLHDGTEDYTWQDIADETYSLAEAMMKAKDKKQTILFLSGRKARVSPGRV
ncbi:MAG: hypothetical protein PHV05_07940 [Candidatus Riflebacteria bacterium]|nr:hypothetical protein [Candidatus Riflebacteria bacterium]